MAKPRLVASYDKYSPDFPRREEPGRRKILKYMTSFEASWHDGHVYDPVQAVYTNVHMEAYCIDGWAWDTQDVYLFRYYNLALAPDFVEMVMSR